MSTYTELCIHFNLLFHIVSVRRSFHSVLFYCAAIYILYSFTALHVQFAFRCFWFGLVFCLSSTKTERACFELICVFFKLAQSVTLVTCVRQVHGSSLGLEKKKHSVCGFCGFQWSLQANVKCLQVREENCALLDYYAASGCNFLLTFRDKLSVPSSGSKNLGLLTLRMEPIGCPETPVTNYHYLRYNPERCSSQLLRGGSLKSRLQVRSQL